MNVRSDAVVCDDHVGPGRHRLERRKFKNPEAVRKREAEEDWGGD